MEHPKKVLGVTFISHPTTLSHYLTLSRLSCAIHERGRVPASFVLPEGLLPTVQHFVVNRVNHLSGRLRNTLHVLRRRHVWRLVTKVNLHVLHRAAVL